jgi:hypothetical protein
MTSALSIHRPPRPRKRLPSNIKGSFMALTNDPPAGTIYAAASPWDSSPERILNMNVSNPTVDQLENRCPYGRAL